MAGRDLEVWAPGPDGVPVDGARAALPAGTAVVVGPRPAAGSARSDADDEVVAAIAGLTTLVTGGGILAAGAGVRVGPRA